MTVWTEQQEGIFRWFESGEGNLVVRARAGTGKTTTILEGLGRAPDRRALLAAFNKRIALELQERLPRGSPAQAKTLHAVGYGIVRKRWAGVRLDKDGSRLEAQLDEAVEAAAPRNVRFIIGKLAGMGKQACPFAARVARVDSEGNVLEDGDLTQIADAFDCWPEEENERAGWTIDRVERAAIEVMKLSLREDGFIDFNDMLYVPVRNGWVEPGYDLVCIDEAQDMNACQLMLAVGLSNPGTRICVVGDDRQAIYGFRGADTSSLDRLKQELQAEELPLTITQRCPRLVVDQARVLVSDFEAARTAPEGQLGNTLEAALPTVVRRGDFVLSRTNAPLVRVCLAIGRAGTPAKIEGREFGKALSKVVRARRAGTLAELFPRLRQWSAKEIDRAHKRGADFQAARIEDQVETIQQLADGLSTVEQLVARIEGLFTDNADPRDVVVCSSVHRAKGLEAARVFLLRNTFYPWPDSEREQEEQNIEYVATTRAKDTLTLVFESTVPENPFQPGVRMSARRGKTVEAA